MASNLQSGGHIFIDFAGQAALDRSTKKSLQLAIQSMQNTSSETWLRRHGTVRAPYGEATGTSLSSSRSGTARSSPNLASQKLSDASESSSTLVQLAEARRLAYEELLGPKAETCRRRIKQPQIPLTPLAEASLDWGREARSLERPALSRLLHSLQERLDREQMWRDNVEAKLARRSSLCDRPPSSAGQAPHLPSKDRPLAAKLATSRSFASLGDNQKALAVSLGKSNGTWSFGAAGIRSGDRTSSSSMAMGPKHPWPRNAEPRPWATWTEEPAS